MNTRRIILIIILIFLTFLGLYTWNIRTHVLDETATHTGLEATGGVLKIADKLTTSLHSLWFNYFDLVDAREESELLKEEVAALQRQLDTMVEEMQELERLREFFAMEAPEEWGKVVTRVLSGKLGAFSSLETIVLDKGYLSGAIVGRPITTNRFLVGRIYKASPTTSMALLVEDFGSKIAVYTSVGRIHGVLSGTGTGKPMELHFINQDATILPGEILYTSGIDDAFPKGLPVARITGSQPIMLNAFKVFYAEPLADFSVLEDLIILTPPIGWQSVQQNEVLSKNPRKILEELEAEQANQGEQGILGVQDIQTSSQPSVITAE